jgi:Rod binding domain-containing protein
MGPIRDVTQAAQAVETCLLRQLIESSGAFRGDGMAGGQIHAEMFVDALADAVEKGGGIGLARLIEKSLPAAGTDDAALTNDSSAQSEPGALNTYRERAEVPISKRPQAKGDWP